MRIFRHYETLPEEARGATIAIGNFDGVHRGHQAVINEAGLIARDAGMPWAVLTFEPHPRSVFKPGSEPYRLTSFRTKARELEKLGVDAMIVQRFNRAFSQRPAEDFVTDVLVAGFGARHVVAGYDFVFGHGRGGTCELLLAMGKRHGFGFTTVSAVEGPDGIVFSSTAVRERLKAGDPKGAAAILGRPHSIEGRVAHGDKRGRTIGFPTANIHLGQSLRPTRGVYAVRVEILDGPSPMTVDGVANVGGRPTVDGTADLLEVFLFGFDGDLYGRILSVGLIDFIRPERKFDGLDQLKRQIAEDTGRAKEVLSG